MHARDARRAVRGFTLVELTFFLVVLALGLAGILAVSTEAVLHSADPQARKQAVAIAESLMEEILLKAFARPPGSVAVACCGAGWSRAQADTVSDYNGYTSAAITDQAGAAVPGLARYSVAPPVAVIDANLLNGVVARRVTVSITGPAGVTTLVGYRTDY